jgi:DNA polymerase III delta prime subunit
VDAAAAVADAHRDGFPRRRDSFPHALLIHGPRGIGKHALALGLAQGLLCETPRAEWDGVRNVCRDAITRSRDSIPISCGSSS